MIWNVYKRAVKGVAGMKSVTITKKPESALIEMGKL